MADPLPKGVRLLHIGPAKTGTTSLQSAFHANRVEAREYGVHYAGSGQQVWYAAQGALGLSPQNRTRRMKEWNSLVAEVQASDADRVVISSEAFAHADDVSAGAILDAFGRDRTHVVITMRPLGDMLSSSWWQYVQGGLAVPYDEWLKRILLENDETKVAHGFWRRSRIDVLAAHWAARVGPENVTIISLADQPRDFVIRTFEELTALPTGTLVPRTTGSNTTLPYPILELARQLNVRVKELGRTDKRKVHLNRMSTYNMIKRHSDVLSDTSRIETPAWAVERAGEIVAEMNDAIRALGVNVIGDLDALTRPSRPAPESTALAPTMIPISDAASVVLYMMLAAERQTTAALKKDFAKREARRIKRTKARARQDRQRLRRSRPRPEDLSGRQLLGLLARRAKRKITRG